MKYKDFYQHLTLKVGPFAYIGPSISIKLGENPSISIKLGENPISNSKFIIFPIKLYGENIRHLNVLILDQNTKIIERYEPFNSSVYQVDNLLEPLLYKLMGQKKIYFLQYKSTLNTENVTNKNCGLYCIKYICDKIKAK